MQLTVPAAALDFAVFDGALPLGSRRSERMAKSVASAEENNIKKPDGTFVMHAANVEFVMSSIIRKACLSQLY